MDNYKRILRLIKFEEHLPLERFLTAVSIITILILAAISIVTYTNAEKSQENAKMVSHTYEVIAKVNGVVISVRDAGSKAVVFTQGLEKTPPNLKEYQGQTNKIITELRFLLSDDSEQRRYLNMLDTMSVQRYLILNKSLQEYKKNPKNKSIQSELSNTGRILSDSIRVLSKIISDREEGYLKARDIESESSNTYSKFFILITSLIGFAVIGFSLYLTKRLIGLRNDTYYELQKSYDIVENKVEERTLELKKSNQALTEEISNRNKAEMAIREKEERFQMMADSAPVLIWVAGTNKERTYFNKSWFDFTGSTLQEEIGNGWRKRIHPEDIERYLHTYESAFENRKSFEIEYRMRSANGDYKWLLNKGTPRFEGSNFAGYIGSSVDITKRKTTERHIKIQHSVMRSLALPQTLEEGLRATLKEICSELNWDYGVVRDVPSSNKILGVYYNGKISTDDIYDSGCFIAKDILKLRKGLWKNNLDKDIEAKESFEVGKLNYKTILAFPAADGENITAIFELYNKNSLEPKQDLVDILTALGRQVGIFIEHKKAENEIKQMNELLSEKVDERTKELQDTLVELEKEILQRRETEKDVIEKNNLLLLLQEVTDEANKTFDTYRIMQIALDKVCHYTKWPLGHVFISNSKGELISSGLWYKENETAFKPFIDITSALIIKDDEGLPGKARLTKSPHWLAIYSLDSKNIKKYPRIKTALSTSIQSGFAFPVIVNDEVMAVVEFFTTDEKEPGKNFLETMNLISIQIASVFERNAAIEQIKENENKLNTAQRIAHLGNWDWDINEDIITWSDELYNIYGLPKKNESQSYKDYISLIHPEDREIVKETINQTMQTGKPFNYLHRIITPQGITKILNAQGQVIKDDSGKIVRIYGTALDVTDLKRTEEELRETYNKLQTTQSELLHKEKLAALGRFSSGIAHEIRNPLANISALAQILNKAPLDDKLKKHIKYILINSDIANKIIKDLLNFASPDELSFAPESIAPIFEDIYESVESRCNEKKIKLIKNIRKGIPPIQLDKKKLNLAFMNFVSNGIDAMPEGGNLTIEAETDKKTNEVVVKFIDTGYGIPKENFDKILEPFFTTKDEGTGLGMGLAYHVIKSHLGHFTIESEEGNGTTIEVRLPITNNKN